MDGPMIHHELRGAVALVTMDRPERRNALDHAALDGLLTALDAALAAAPAWRDLPFDERAAVFLRDVREGRAEYLDRHPLHAGPTLEGQQIRDRHPYETDSTRGNPGTNYAKDGR